jgi:hypothetical protein
MHLSPAALDAAIRWLEEPTPGPAEAGHYDHHSARREILEARERCGRFAEREVMRKASRGAATPTPTRKAAESCADALAAGQPHRA